MLHIVAETCTLLTTGPGRDELPVPESATTREFKVPETTMRRTGPWSCSVVAVLLAGLILGTCLTALAEAAFPSSRVCAAEKGEEVGPSKWSSPSLWAVPVDHNLLPQGLSESRSFSLCPTPDLVSANLSGEISSRAPPLLL